MTHDRRIGMGAFGSLGRLLLRQAVEPHERGDPLEEHVIQNGDTHFERR